MQYAPQIQAGGPANQGGDIGGGAGGGSGAAGGGAPPPPGSSNMDADAVAQALGFSGGANQEQQFSAALRAMAREPLRELQMTPVDEDDRLQCFGECVVLASKGRVAANTMLAPLGAASQLTTATGAGDSTQQQQTATNSTTQQQATGGGAATQQQGATSSVVGGGESQSAGGPGSLLIESQQTSGGATTTAITQQHASWAPQPFTAALNVSNVPRAGDIEYGGARALDETELAPVKLRRINQPQSQSNRPDSGGGLLSLNNFDASGGPTWLPGLKPIPLESLPMLASSHHDISTRGIELIGRLRDGDVVDMDEHYAAASSSSVGGGGGHHHHSSLFGGAGGAGAANASLGATAARNAFAGLRLVQRFHREAACIPPPAVMAAVMDLALGLDANQQEEDNNNNNLAASSSSSEKNNNDEEIKDVSRMAVAALEVACSTVGYGTWFRGASVRRAVRRLIELADNAAMVAARTVEACLPTPETAPDLMVRTRAAHAQQAATRRFISQVIELVDRGQDPTDFCARSSAMMPALTDSEECLLVAAVMLTHHAVHATSGLIGGAGGGAGGLINQQVQRFVGKKAVDDSAALLELPGDASVIRSRTVQARNEVDRTASAKLSFDMIDRICSTAPSSLLDDVDIDFAFWKISCESSILLMLMDFVFGPNGIAGNNKNLLHQQDDSSCSLLGSAEDTMMSDAAAPSALSSAERARQLPTADTLAKIATKLGKDSATVLRVAMTAIDACSIHAVRLWTSGIAGGVRAPRESRRWGDDDINDDDDAAGENVGADDETRRKNNKDGDSDEQQPAGAHDDKHSQQPQSQASSVVEKELFKTPVHVPSKQKQSGAAASSSSSAFDNAEPESAHNTPVLPPAPIKTNLPSSSLVGRAGAGAGGGGGASITVNCSEVGGFSSGVCCLVESVPSPKSPLLGKPLHPSFSSQQPPRHQPQQQQGRHNNNNNNMSPLLKSADNALTGSATTNSLIASPVLASSWYNAVSLLYRLVVAHLLETQTQKQQTLHNDKGDSARASTTSSVSLLMLLPDELQQQYKAMQANVALAAATAVLHGGRSSECGVLLRLFSDRGGSTNSSSGEADTDDGLNFPLIMLCCGVVEGGGVSNNSDTTTASQQHHPHHRIVPKVINALCVGASRNNNNSNCSSSSSSVACLKLCGRIIDRLCAHHIACLKHNFSSSSHSGNSDGGAKKARQQQATTTSASSDVPPTVSSSSSLSSAPPPASSIRTSDLALVISSLFHGAEQQHQQHRQQQRNTKLDTNTTTTTTTAAVLRDVTSAAAQCWIDVCLAWARITPESLSGSSSSSRAALTRALIAVGTSSAVCSTTPTPQPLLASFLQPFKPSSSAEKEEAKQRQQQHQQRIISELNRVWWNLLRPINAMADAARSGNDPQLLVQVLFGATLTLHQLMDLYPAVFQAVASASQQLQQQKNQQHHQSTSSTLQQQSRFLAVAPPQHHRPLASSSSSSASAGAITVGARASSLALAPPVVAALRLVNFESMTRFLLGVAGGGSSVGSSSSLCTSYCCCCDSSRFAAAAVLLANHGAATSRSSYATLLEDAAVDIDEAVGAPAASGSGAAPGKQNTNNTNDDNANAAADGGDNDNSASNNADETRIELLDVWLLRRLLSSHISAKADLAEALRNLPFVTATSSNNKQKKTQQQQQQGSNAAVFTRVARGRAVLVFSPSSSSSSSVTPSLIDYFQKRTNLSPSQQQILLQQHQNVRSDDSTSPLLPAEVRNASLVMVCSASALREMASAGGTTDAGPKFVINQMQRYWDASVAAAKKLEQQQQQQQQVNDGGGGGVYRPAALFLVSASALSVSGVDDGKKQLERQIALFVVHLLRKYGGTWFSVLPVSGEMALMKHLLAEERGGNNKTNVASVDCEIARVLRHTVGVQKTTLLVGSSADAVSADAMKAQCKTNDVPCIAVGDLIARIQQAAATAAAAKK